MVKGEKIFILGVIFFVLFFIIFNQKIDKNKVSFKDKMMNTNLKTLEETLILSEDTTKTYNLNKSNILNKKVNYNNVAKTNEKLNSINKESGYFIFFRGNVSNNYVNFAGKLWRVLGINPDKSVKLILDSSIGNFNYSNDGNINFNKSNIKTNLDNWYQENIDIEDESGFKYSGYVVKDNYCNDTSKDIKYKNVYDRIYNLKIPSLKCSNKINSKIGLPTTDEIIIAGSRANTINKNNYIYKGNSFWTMSDGVPLGTKNLENIEKYTNYKNEESIKKILKEKHNIRPVITISKDAYIKRGTGIKSSPYELTTNIFKLKEQVLVLEGKSLDIEEAKRNIEQKPRPDFNKTATTKEGMFAEVDDYGTSYYYRGKVDNNYVKFGDFYWRIVRITGSGNIRMIYQGKTPNATGDAAAISRGSFYPQNTDEQYVGYVQETSGINSNAKKVIDAWYKTNFHDTELTKYLADEGFCGDRSLPEGGKKYGASIRLDFNSNNPRLTCPSKVDNYTVSDFLKGNKKLTYPVALLSADEIVFSGGVYSEEYSGYLATGKDWWLLTPYAKYSDEVAIFFMDSGSYFMWMTPDYSCGFRPVINLKNSAVNITKGTGTVSNPYILNEVKKVKSPSEIILEKAGGTSAIRAKGRPNFSQYATTNQGMYSEPDDYGTSYYFRGSVNNNYVKFAGFYWRIVRITGTGNIKLIYQGTSSTGNGNISSGTFNSSVTQQQYIGYVQERSGSNSAIKSSIDSWYQTNIVNKGYSKYISDEGFCGDRSGLSYGSSGTYAAGNRMTMSGENNPLLRCPSRADNYTVNDTSKGNAKLRYPVALLSADEASLAGTKLYYTSENQSFYLYTGADFWLLTPYHWNGRAGSLFSLSRYGGLSVAYTEASHGYRPVIHVNNSALNGMTGQGTASNPYQFVLG